MYEECVGVYQSRWEIMRSDWGQACYYVTHVDTWDCLAAAGQLAACVLCHQPPPRQLLAPTHFVMANPISDLR